jgi:hypothetical protein
MLRPRTFLLLAGSAAVLAAAFLSAAPATASAATVTALITTTSTANAATYASGAFTPAKGDLLVAFVVVSGSNDTGAMSDTQDLGFALATSTTMGAGANTLYVFVAQRFATSSSMTVTMQVPNGAGTGAAISVAEVSGMTRAGPGALRQVAVAANQAAGTPAIAFPGAVLTGDPALGFVGNATNPATLTPPSGWTENADVGFATPTIGAEYASVNSGFTGTTVTWGGASATAWGGIAIEMDTSAPPSSNIWPNCVATEPCVIQSMMTANTGAEPLNGFQLHFPQPTLSGNMLVLSMYRDQDSSTSAPINISSIVNDNGGTWIQGPATRGEDEMIDTWYLPNAPANIDKVTVTYNATTSNEFISLFNLVEISGVATSSPLDGTATVSSSSLSMLQPGAITTTNNGDLIYNSVAEDGLFSYQNLDPGGITPDNSSVLLGASPFGKAAEQFTYQPTHGAINPAMYVDDPGGNEQPWFSAAMAFKGVSGAGTQPSSSIRIVRLLHYNDGNNITPAPVVLPFPTSGNLQVFATTDVPPSSYTITNLADSAGDPWTEVTRPDTTNDPQIWYAPNTTPNQANYLTWVESVPYTYLTMWDIAGAAASPYDTSAHAEGSQAAAGNPILDAPDITPDTANGLILDFTQYGQGPPSAATGTAGIIFDSVYANGMTDSDAYDTGDGNYTYFNATTGTVKFGALMANTAASFWDGLAVAFEAATSTGSTASSTCDALLLDFCSADYFVRGQTGSIFGNSNSTDFLLQDSGQSLAMPVSTSADFILDSGVLSPVYKAVKPAYTQIHYQWRNDDGTEATATSATAGNEDTPLASLVQNTNIRVRMEISNDGGTILNYTPQSFTLQYGLQSSTCALTTSWTTVGANGASWAMANSTYLTDGSSTTDIATSTGGVLDGNHTFIVNNAGVKDTTSTVASTSVPSDSFMEMEFSINALTSSTPNGTYCFRLTNQGSAQNFVYSEYPQATVSSAQSISLTLSTSTVQLPGLSPGVAVTASTTATVAVNGASSGYTVSIQRNSATSTLANVSSTAITFPDFTSWAPTGSTCAPGQGNGATSTGNTFSFRVASSGTTANYCSPWWGASDAAGTAIYSGVPTTSQIIANSTSSASQNGTTTVSVLYSANAPANQKAGSYTGGVTITAIANP